MMSEQFFSALISPILLFSHISDENWVAVDCRFDLTKPVWGEIEYEKGHIPGACYAHLDCDLSGPVSSQTGRHPLPDPEVMANRLGSWGIDNETQVVVYDSTGGAYAARLWWQLRFLGHTRVAVLDGGYNHWIKAGYPIFSSVLVHPARNFVPQPNWAMVIDTPGIEILHSDPTFLLVDARAQERFSGEKEPIDAVAGHIPGAVNRFHGMNLSQGGVFLPADELRAQFTSLLGDIPPENGIMYCGSGVTSCHHILAMEVAGMPGARLYAGSWSEWIRDPNHPTTP